MTSPLDDDLLQRFYDGDLSPLEEHAVQVRIESEPTAQARLAQLGRLTELLREGTARRATGLDSDALFASIERRLGGVEDVPTGTRLRVVGAEWLEHRRSTVIAIAASLAVAAATLIAVLQPSQPLEDDGALTLAPGEEQPPTLPLPVETQVAVTVHGSQIEAVDFGASSGTVFELDDEGVQVAVVWISDEEP